MKLPTVSMNLLSNAGYSSLSVWISCLGYEDLGSASLHAMGGQEDVFYEEPDLSGGVEGVDYVIRYGAGNEEEESD